MYLSAIEEVRAKLGGFADLESHAPSDASARLHACARVGGAPAQLIAREHEPAPPQIMLSIIDAVANPDESAPVRSASEEIAQLDIVEELDARIAHARTKICAASCAIRSLLIELARTGKLRMARASTDGARASGASRDGGVALSEDLIHQYTDRVMTLRAMANALVVCMPQAEGFTTTQPEIPESAHEPTRAPQSSAPADTTSAQSRASRMIEIARDVMSAERALLALVDELKKTEFIADFVIAQCAALRPSASSAY